MDQEKPVDFVESENGIVLNEPIPDAQPNATTVKPPKKHEAKIVGVLLFLMVAGFAIFAATQVDYVAISDMIAGSNYSIPDNLKEIIADLDFTDDGMRILKASHPELQEAEEFNSSCTNELEQAVLLGCYASRNGHIYIYNAQNKDLAGLHQSILAHEFLHAVWARLGEDEKIVLNAELQKIYDENESVRKNMDIYSDKRDPNELHSVIGQSIKSEDLPEKLRHHYEKYFNDRAKVVGFYDSYSAPFKKLQDRIEVLKADIEKRRAEFTAMQAEYTEKDNQLRIDVEQFNACSRTYGCFQTVEAFAEQRESLETRKTQLYADYYKIQEYNASLNAVIEEYNTLVSDNEALQKSINSHASEEDN